MYKFLPSGVFTIEPYSSGSLSGLNFSIKDNINIAQYKTSYGSPSWQVNIRALLQKCGGDRGTTPEPQIFPSVQIIHG